MATPCRKCGAEKTENVHHSTLYALAKLFGYRLRMCSRCHRLRLTPRHPERSAPRVEREPASKVEIPGSCPRCGKNDFRRSRRRLWERMFLRGPMVRCRACHTRFPLPRPVGLAGRDAFPPEDLN
jgi:hypothetical protein